MGESLTLRFGLKSDDMLVITGGQVVPEGYVVREIDDSTCAAVVVRESAQKIFDTNRISVIGFTQLIQEVRLG